MRRLERRRHNVCQLVPRSVYTRRHALQETYGVSLPRSGLRCKFLLHSERLNSGVCWVSSDPAFFHEVLTGRPHRDFINIDWEEEEAVGVGQQVYRAVIYLLCALSLLTHEFIARCTAPLESHVIARGVRVFRAYWSNVRFAVYFDWPTWCRTFFDQRFSLKLQL